MSQLYKYVGITRQAIDQYGKRQQIFNKKLLYLLSEVEELRKDHPGCGVEKMYYSLNPDFLGRDKFVELFMDLGFGLKKRINYKRTTYSVTSKYNNLIKGLFISEPGVVWQTDITYYDVDNKFYYVVFIIDVYTKIIVGYNVSDNMRATANIKAMKMALANYKAPFIHHSDRGGQYIYSDYIKLLRDNKCEISMCKSSQDNAYAERINRTIKEEYLDHWQPSDFEQLKRYTRKAVDNYNNKRIHNNLDKMNPVTFLQTWQKQKQADRKTITIFNNNLN
ncbi:MAG: IS3 family transposase [Bacteroidota bacterium]|nr:IS3 family transposase [Bacteroidota bacterium]